MAPYMRSQFTCAKCERTWEGSTAFSFAAICTCGNPMLAIHDEANVVYVIAETPDAAEGAVHHLPHNAIKRETAEQAYRRWEDQPDMMKRRYKLFGVRKIAQYA